MTRNTSTIASSSVLTTSSIETRTKGVVSKGTTAFDARREERRQLVERASTPLAVVERVGAGRERDGDAGGRLCRCSRLMNS